MEDKRLILCIFNTVELQHLKGNHWILAAVDPMQSTITIFNSLKGQDDPLTIARVNALQTYFRYRLMKEFYVVYARVNVQENNYDCGCFGELKANICIWQSEF